MSTNKRQFNVLHLKFNNKKIEYCDVLPYFRDCWKEGRFKKEDVTDKKSLKEWIKRSSQYQFWTRCQYEFLIAPWPLGSYKINQDLNKFITPEFNINDYRQNIDFYNILMQDMHKIDIHEQIMMNIDIIVDILWEEFYVTKV